MKKHILVISIHYYPENFRITDLCEKWVKRGYKVTVVTGIPNYPEGKFYKGYGWFKKRKEVINGVDVRRLRILARKNGKMRLALNYFSFLFRGFFFAKFNKVKADYLFTFGISPLIQARIANWYKKNKQVKRIIYVQDLWPENLVAVGINNKLLYNYVDKMMRKIYKKTDLVLTTSNSFIDSIENMGVCRDRIKFWPQYCEDFYSPFNDIPTINDIPKDDTANFIFTGNIGVAQGLDILVEAAKIIKDSGHKVRFNIVGDGREKENLIEKVSSNTVGEFFNFIGRQDAKKIPEYLSLCDAALLTFNESPIFERTIPAKFQSYIACGMPIIGCANGEIARIITENDLGLCSNVKDAEGIAQNVLLFIEMTEERKKAMSNNALSYSKLNFDEEALLDDFDKNISELMEV